MTRDAHPVRFALVSAEHGTFRLEPGANEIGRAATATVALRDRSISQRHAIIEVLDTKVLVRDLASKNGTFVNGTPAEAIEAQAGDQIRFGRFAFRLETLDSGDAWLAVRAPDSADPTKVGKSVHTTVVTQTEATEIETHRIRAFVRDIADSTARGEHNATLATLTRELGATSAMVLEFEGSSEIRVLASTGSLEVPSSGLKEMLPSFSDQPGTSGDPTYTTGSHSGASFTVASRHTDGRRVALVVPGNWPSDSGGGWLISTTLSLICLGSQEATSVASGSRAMPNLVFPENHVRCPSRSMIRLYADLRLAADSDLPVLIEGETGVGKESIASILHCSSKRSRGPCLPINCAAIPPDLLEAELFGVSPGAATGVSPRIGKLETANGGTVLLDEIGEMKRELQVKLLRVLEQKSVEPVGGSSRPLDIRIVASTNHDLRQEISTGRFRPDLYYRLAGFVLKVPALRHRKNDIPALVEHFFLAGSRETGKRVKGITYAALKALTERDWPGNVRELRHAVLRAVHATPDGEVIDSRRIHQIETAAPSAAIAHTLFRGERELRLDELERAAIQEALRRTDGNQAAATHALGISRAALRRRIAKHGLEKEG